MAGDAFKKRLTDLKPKLTEFAYAPESYDATILVALAATAAKDDAGASIASKMQDVSPAARHARRTRTASRC